MIIYSCSGSFKKYYFRHNLKIALNSLRFLDIGGLKIKTIQIDCPNLEIIDVSYTFLETNVIEHIISGVPRLTNFWAKKQSNVTPVLLRYNFLYHFILYFSLLCFSNNST